MKRTIGLAIAAALTIGASPAMGQGIMAGWVNAGAKITEDGQDIDTGTRNGFTAGVVFGRQSGLIGFRSEALYTQKGFTVGSGSQKLTFKPAYIDVPVMLKVDAIIVRAYAGPQLSFRISCTLDGAIPSNPILPESSDSSCTDQVESFDFGFKGGVGASLAIFDIDLVGTMGTKNFAKVNKDSINAKNQTISLVIGVSMP